MAFDWASPRLVLAGTAWGEARGCGAAAMQNVAQCVLNRVAAGWPGADDPLLSPIVGICLHPLQFSAWNGGADPNRARILEAAALGVEPAWIQALGVADAAIAGHNPDRVLGADSYFAASMRHMPYWAIKPAVQTYTDGWHRFWRVKPAGHAPVVSVHASTEAIS